MTTESRQSAIVREPWLVLVVQHSPKARAAVRATLEHAGYEILEAPDCKTALEVVARRRPDLVIQDLILPDMDGLELARVLRGQFGAAGVPILCISGFLSRLDEARAMKSGFAHVLVKPVDPGQLLDIVKRHLVRPVMTESAGIRRRLLVVDKDPAQRKLVQANFSSAGFDVIEAEDGLSALEVARRQRPAVIVSDVLMPKMDGFSLCLAVRRDKELGTTPVVLSSWAYMEEADRMLATRVGASALLSKTEGLEAVTRAVLAALQAPPPPAEVEIEELSNGQHLQRVMWQLERQVQESARLLKRSTHREAQLQVLDGVAEALAKNRPVDGVLGDVLAACLDMAGITKGALYISDAGHLGLKHQIGFSGEEAAGLADMFGCRANLVEVANASEVVLVPSLGFPADVAQQLIVGAGVTSLLLVPVSWAATTYGLMVLGARTIELTGQDASDFASALGARMGLAIGLAQSFSKLAESEQRYRNLTENANDAICILTPTGTICEVNRRLTEIVGKPAAQIVGKHILDFASQGEGQHDLTSGAGPAPPVSIRTSTGETMLVEFSRTHVRVGGEDLVLAIGRDVTEQVRVQAQLMTSDRMASVGALAAGVAHEINNPLAAVLANLDFAVEDAALLDEQFGASPRLREVQDSLRDARFAADRVRQIVRDLRIFARAEEDRRGPVDTHRVLESTIRMAWNEIRHRARLIKVFGEIPLVEANEARLGQVFLNIIINAAQAIDEGRADANEIRVTTSTDPIGRVVVEVRDTGPGMPPEILKKLFTPFFTTKTPGVGTGLGLAICQRIVTDLGGEIAVTSKVGVGTTFRIVLPVAHSRPEAIVVPPIVAPNTHRGRVLLVDDDEMLANAVGRSLSGQHEVVVLTSAREALSCIDEGQRFDVILCDMMMPIVTGMDFYEHLLVSARDQADRIVFLTGGAFTVGAREFLDRVPNLRMEKPFNVKELRALVNERVALV